MGERRWADWGREGNSLLVWLACGRYGGALCSGCGLPPQGAGSTRRDLRTDALGHGLQHSLVKGFVIGGDDGPARLGTPSGVLQLGAEDGHVDRHLSIAHERSVRICGVGGKTDLELLRPDDPVAIRQRFQHELSWRGEARVLLRRGLPSIGGKCRDVHERGHLGIHAGLGNYRAAPRMPNQNRGPILLGQGSLRGRNVIGQRDERILDDRDAIAALP
jgi:hypothetical protein